MSLYDDEETFKSRTTEKVAEWSSGIKLLQSHMQLKKAAVTQPKRDASRRSAQVLPPVINLKSKKDDADIKNVAPLFISANVKDSNWNIDDEYDPMWPNDYEKVCKELREKRERRTKPDDDRNEREDRRRKSNKYNNDDEEPPEKQLIAMQADEEEYEEPSRRNVGAAIAPPPSLQETVIPSGVIEKAAVSFSGGSVAAKIMAKYGFKEGQGLGKKEQGMSVALQVEKTSKRGGRIIHEKDNSIMPPPPLSTTPPPKYNEDEFDLSPESSKPEPTITEIMKSPSKVVLLRNMVGPGDVDQDLEPEVKDECNTKYGDVIKVIIFEIPNVHPEEAVRIFVEFKRIESAIKAVVDLNGRFFGGRQVKAGFYEVEKFNLLQLLE